MASESGNQSGRVAGKTALITGGGSGLGREVALLLSREGARVAVSDVQHERARAVAEEIGDSALALTADVTDESQVAAAVDDAVREFGGLDIVHANAGIAPREMGTAHLDEIPQASWDEISETNLRGVFFSIKHAARVMKANPGGSIIATSSAAAFVSYPGMAIYAASKGGVNALVRGSAFELAQYGIRVNAVCPTHGMSPNFGLPKHTPALGLSWEQLTEWDAEASPIPLKLPTPPKLIDNAYPVLFLASEESRYMSGVCIPTADGGTLSQVAIPFPSGWTFEGQVEQTLRSLESSPDEPPRD